MPVTFKHMNASIAEIYRAGCTERDIRHIHNKAKVMASDTTK